MSKGKCDLYPEVNGEDSKLYKDLLEKLISRPLSNLIYAAYLQQGVAAQMNQKGFKVNKQGQHSAKAVIQYFDANSMKNEAGKASDIAMRIGAKDSSGNLVNFTSAKEALQKAAQSNSNTRGVVSYVVQRGNSFNIITEARDSRTQMRAAEVEKSLAMWGVIEQAFAGIGIDVNGFDFNKNLVNANNSKGFLSWLKNLEGTRDGLYSQMDIRTILAMDENSSQVQRLKRMFGTIDEVAEKIYDAFHSGTHNYTQDQLNLMHSAIYNCKKVQGLDLVSLQQQVDQVEGSTTVNSILTSDITLSEEDISKTLKELDEKYNISFNEMHRKRDRITQLSHAAEDAAFTLKRQLRKLKAKEGVTSEVKDLESLTIKLTREVANKKYYSGIMGFLGHALSQIQTMEQLFKDANQAPGTNLERGIARAKALMEIKSIRDGYEHIIESLSKIDTLIVDESISDLDIKTIKDNAKEIREIFDNYDNKIKDLRETTMIDLAVECLGSETYNGASIADIVTMAESDSSINEILYSMSRVSNPLIASMGGIIEDAQNERTKKLMDISIRIRRANKKLVKAKFNSSFMYEPGNNYIISDIDWDSYKKAKNQAYNKFIAQGKRGIELAEIMEQWEEENTEDRTVDFVSKRTERVPNKNYRKAFPELSKAQKDYYDEMMQIKGELGTLLPKYAQKQYLPPQTRRDFLDAIVSSKGNPKVIAKAILNKIKDIFIIREDDPLNSKNGIIDGEEYGITSGDLDNTPYRQIPIFYINRLKDQDELLKDFSGALQRLAGTAINYDCMNKIKDTIEFMGDFIKEKAPSATKDGKKQVDVITTKGIRMFKDLVGFARNTNTIGIIDGFIDKHLYGVQLKNVNKWTKLLSSFLAYNSMRALAVNLKGMLANYIVGELQMLIESGAMEFYNPIDYAWANMKVFGDNTIGAPGRIMDFMTNNENSKSVLLAQKFDPMHDMFEELSKERYSKYSFLTKKDLRFIGYGAGEHMLHYVTMYAVLHNQKVKIGNKKATLYDAFYVGNKVDGNSELLLKDNVTYKDKNGNWVPVDEAFLDSIRDKIKYCNQSTHGAMNTADKGLIHQKMLGRYVMNLRQWMVEHYSRRFRKAHWDATLNEEREGYYNTVGKFMWNWCKALFNFETEYASRWSELTDAQKSNCGRAMAEQVVLASLLLLEMGLGEPEDHKKEFWYRMWIYQTKRAIMEVRGSTPYGVPMEIDKLINSPISATSTTRSVLYPFYGISDINKEVKSGKYKDWNLYGRNLYKYWLPFTDQLDQYEDFGENDSVFKLFETTKAK